MRKRIIEDNGRSERLKGIIYSLYDIDVTTKIRPRNVVDMRKIYCKILYDTGLTISHIARTLGFDHATVIHHNKKIKDLMETDPIFMSQYRAVYDVFKSFKPDFIKSDIKSIDDKKALEQMLHKVVDYDQRLEVSTASEKILKGKIDSLIDEINLLKQELAELRGEKRELVPIMKLVRERTRKGQESFVFKKIQSIYNGV